MRKVQVSILTLNWNSSDVTIAMLKSLKILDKSVPYEVVIVDNGSRPEELSKLEIYIKHHRGIRLYKAHENLGFCKGNNLGAKLCKGEYICFLNNDTEVVDKNFLWDMLFPLISCMDVSTPHVMKYKTKKIFHGGGLGLNAFGMLTDEGLKWPLGFKMPDIYIGTCWMMRKKLFQDMGGLWEKLFIYWDEVDFSLRLKKNGYHIVCVPTTITHRINYSIEINNANDMERMLMIRNRYLVLHRNFGLKFWPWLPLLLSYDIFRVIKYRKSKAFIEAMRQLLGGKA